MTERFEIPRIGIWTFALDSAPAARARELAGELEELGYGALWIPEVAGRDPFVHLALLLSSTSRLIGATGIANIWARDPLATSGAIKSLTEAFPERALIGLGVSHQVLVNDLRGHDYKKPLSAMRRYLEALDQAPYRAHAPSTPDRRVLAALRPKMLQLAGEKTDGAHTYFVTPEHTAKARGILGAEPLLCAEQAVVLESDPDAARAIGRTYTSFYLALPNYVHNLLELGFTEQDMADGGTDAVVDALVAWGDEDTIVARVKEHLDAGADHVAVQALPKEKRGVPDGQWRQLAEPLLSLA
ncbi:MAG TPA: LLM class F420-dependent oxidoreductase [Pseudonocardia sp.]